MIKVKNVQGKYIIPKGYDSWIDYWKKKTGNTVSGCEKEGCKKNNDIVGGHVFKQGDDENIYLIPICHVHNSDDFETYYNVPSDKLLLVPKNDLERDTLDEWLDDNIKSNNK